MESTNDRYIIPFGLGSELDAASFQLNDEEYHVIHEYFLHSEFAELFEIL